MTGKENWVQKMLNDQWEKLCNNPKVTNQTCKFETQIMIERSNPLLEPIETGQPVDETGRTQTRSSDDCKILNVEMAHNRTRQPVVETHTDNVPDGSQTRSVHASIRFNVGDKTIRDRTVQPVVNRDDSCHEQTMLNEVNMDFRIPRLPHSVVKHAESSRVRELVK